MRDSKQQRCVQKHASLKVARKATNGDKHINEESKQTLPTISSKYLLNTGKVCFRFGTFTSMLSIYEIMTKLCVF